jgi:hypothetical protein
MIYKVLSPSHKKRLNMNGKRKQATKGKLAYTIG